MNIRKLRILLLRLSAIPFVFLAVFVRPRWDVESPAAFIVELVGYLFVLGGLTIRMWSILYIGGRKSHQLATSGPYSICRNPLYVGTLLLIIGVGLCFENVLMLGATLIIFVPIHLLAVRREERRLEARFPTDYLLYKHRVPRFLPRFRNYQSPPEVVVSPRVIRRAMADMVAVLLLPAVEDMLEVMHRTGFIPVLWRFP